MTRALLSLLGAMACSIAVTAQQQPATPPTEQPFRIVKSDPALDELIASDAKLELIAEHIGLSEGPLWIRDGQSGFLVFSDVAANVIYKRSADGALSVFLERAGFTGTDNLNVGQQTISGGRVAIVLIGSNGLALDQEGRLVITAMADRAVVRLEKNGTRTLLADRYQGMRLSGPNDVVVKSNGAVYFTDSINGLRGGASSPQRELPFNGFYLIKGGRIVYLGGDRDQGGGAPNGITLSPDEKYLYVTAGRTVMRYEIQSDDTVANARVFVQDFSDGMKTDVRGNLYTTTAVGGRASIRITSSEGKELGFLQLPVVLKEPRPRICATNVAFGDDDNRGLYITACSTVYRVQMKVPGTRLATPPGTLPVTG